MFSQSVLQDALIANLALVALEHHAMKHVQRQVANIEY
jgi:hypothetical protein